MKGFTKFFLSRDRLGHPFSLNYLGSETHQTWFGAALSMVINILVLIILAQKTDAMLNMTDPEVQVFKRPIFEHEVEKAGEINFASHKMHIGFATYIRNEHTFEYGPIPPEVIVWSGNSRGK